MKLLLMMYNLIEYSYNYSDTLGSLWQFKRDEIEEDAGLTLDADHILNNSSSLSINQVLLQTELVEK